MAQEAGHVQHTDPVSDHGHHPSPRKYVFIGVVLAIVTAIEVAFSYMNMSDTILVTSLLIMALVKFVMVASWFMHLKFDSRIFKYLFVTGIITALLVFTVVLVLFFTRGGPAPVVTG